MFPAHSKFSSPATKIFVLGDKNRALCARLKQEISLLKCSLYVEELSYLVVKIENSVHTGKIFESFQSLFTWLRFLLIYRNNERAVNNAGIE